MSEDVVAVEGAESLEDHDHVINVHQQMREPGEVDVSQRLLIINLLVAVARGGGPMADPIAELAHEQALAAMRSLRNAYPRFFRDDL